MTTVNYNAQSTLDTSGITIVDFPSGVTEPTEFGQPTSNASGITIINGDNAGIAGIANFNLAPGSLTEINGTMSGYGQIFEGPNALLVNDGTISGSSATIDANVVGVGTFDFGPWHDSSGYHNLSGYYGPGLTFNETGSMTLYDPRTFFSQINFEPSYPYSTLDLAGLSATSYDIKNDLLRLYQGNAEVYQVRMSVPSWVGPIAVQSGPDMYGGGGPAGVQIIGEISGGGTVTGLPLHSGV
jgi:hypothetical protein